MQNFQWVHIPLRRGLSLLSEKGAAVSLPMLENRRYSAWALVLSDDRLYLDGRIAGMLFVEELPDRHELRLHLGWMEHSAQTRGKRARMVADMVLFAWARWIDAQRLFLVGERGEGVALTREMTDEGDARLQKWVRSRMRSSYRPQPIKEPTEGSSARRAFA